MITLLCLFANEGLGLVEAGNMHSADDEDFQEGFAPEGMYKGADGVYRQRRTCQRYGFEEDAMLDAVDEELGFEDFSEEEDDDSDDEQGDGWRDTDEIDYRACDIEEVMSPEPVVVDDGYDHDFGPRLESGRRTQIAANDGLTRDYRPGMSKRYSSRNLPVRVRTYNPNGDLRSPGAYDSWKNRSSHSQWAKNKPAHYPCQ